MGLFLFLEAISLYGQHFLITFCQVIFSTIPVKTLNLNHHNPSYTSDHYYGLTTAYWVVFTFVLIATIIVLAVGEHKTWLNSCFETGANLHIGGSSSWLQNPLECWYHACISISNDKNNENNCGSGDNVMQADCSSTRWELPLPSPARLSWGAPL